MYTHTHTHLKYTICVIVYCDVITPSPSASPRFSTKDFSGTAPHGVTGHPAGETGVRVNTRTSQPSGTPQPRDHQDSLNTHVSANGPHATSAGGTVNTTQAVGRDSVMNVTDFSARPSGGVTDIGVKGAGAGLQTSLQTVAACLLLVCWGSACLLRWRHQCIIYILVT